MFDKLVNLFKSPPANKPEAKDSKNTTQAIGSWAEDHAADYLLKQGLSLRERNYRCKAGEIDLIMLDKNNALVFVEVRARNNLNFGSGLDSVTHHKQQRLIRAAKHYLQHKRLLEKLPCRFDVISVCRPNSIEWIPNAFSAPS